MQRWANRRGVKNGSSQCIEEEEVGLRYLSIKLYLDRQEVGTDVLDNNSATGQSIVGRELKRYTSRNTRSLGCAEDIRLRYGLVFLL